MSYDEIQQACDEHFGPDRVEVGDGREGKIVLMSCDLNMHYQCEWTVDGATPAQVRRAIAYLDHRIARELAADAAPCAEPRS